MQYFGWYRFVLGFPTLLTVSKILRIVLSVPIIIVIVVTLKFHNFLTSLARSKYFSFFSFSLIFTPWQFLHQLTLMVFHWSLSDSKFPHVSRTFLSILADLNHVVVWMVSTRPLISKSSNPFKNPSVTVPRAPITIWYKGPFHVFSFFNFRGSSTYSSFHSLLLCGQPEQQSPQFWNFSFFVFDYYKACSSGRD